MNGEEKRMWYFEELARGLANVPTLQASGQEDLDYHRIPVWALLAIMHAAYRYGIEEGRVKT